MLLRYLVDKIMKENIDQFKLASRGYSDASVIMHEAIAAKAGLTGADHKYLSLIIKKGEMTAGELSVITGLTTGAVTGLIDRLEKKKLLSRKFDKADRRKVLIVPNVQNATKLLAPFFAELQEKTANLLEAFSTEELSAIERYFTSATAIMQEVTHNLNTK